MGKSSFVVCKLPKAGLGNQLFPLMNALIFSELNQLPVIITGYHQFKLGPYIRRERSKRKYHGYFTFQKNVMGEFVDNLKIAGLRKRKTIIKDYKLVKLSSDNGKNLFLFEQQPHYSDYFKLLKEHHAIVLILLNKILRPWIQEKLKEIPPPVIGVHIRMGDFRKLNDNEDFSKVGSVRTPENYFVDIINGIREINGNDLPVSIFTDGYSSEFTLLPKLNNLKFIVGNHDIVDLLLLSKSKVLIASAGSTFSLWAGFLSKGIFILHHDHIHGNIRPYQLLNYYEGSFDISDSLLIESIKKIKSQ